MRSTNSAPKSIGAAPEALTSTPRTDALEHLVIAASEEARAVKHRLLEEYSQLERELNDLSRQLAAARPSDKSVLLAKMLELGGIQRPEDYLTMAREILRLAEGKP